MSISIRTLIVSTLAMSLFSFWAKADPLGPGAPAPKVTAVDQDGKTVNFADFYAQGFTLVYFYPKADTPGCTAEACSFRDSFASLQAEGLQIIGVSRDTVVSQKKFHDKYHLPFTLVADPDGKIAAAFGVPMMVGGLLPLAKRQSFLISDGVVIWNDLNAQTKGSAEEVQAALDAL